ncbi:uncharacterized protein LOC136752980 isoform X2 [Amia ocellicauda]|uniref:uncharacterized protein LOC136752980 isoform X2 n=1 Tax=Amia ocellicauda TaxID=2972642 RepID=UPI0034648B7B
MKLGHGFQGNTSQWASADGWNFSTTTIVLLFLLNGLSVSCQCIDYMNRIEKFEFILPVDYLFKVPRLNASNDKVMMSMDCKPYNWTTDLSVDEMWRTVFCFNYTEASRYNDNVMSMDSELQQYKAKVFNILGKLMACQPKDWMFSPAQCSFEKQCFNVSSFFKHFKRAFQNKDKVTTQPPPTQRDTSSTTLLIATQGNTTTQGNTMTQGDATIQSQTSSPTSLTSTQPPITKRHNSEKSEHLKTVGFGVVLAVSLIANIVLGFYCLFKSRHLMSPEQRGFRLVDQDRVSVEEMGRRCDVSSAQ